MDPRLDGLIELGHATTHAAGILAFCDRYHIVPPEERMSAWVDGISIAGSYFVQTHIEPRYLYWPKGAKPAHLMILAHARSVTDVRLVGWRAGYFYEHRPTRNMDGEQCYAWEHNTLISIDLLDHMFTQLKDPELLKRLAVGWQVST